MKKAPDLEWVRGEKTVGLDEHHRDEWLEIALAALTGLQIRDHERCPFQFDGVCAKWRDLQTYTAGGGLRQPFWARLRPARHRIALRRE